MFTRKQRGFTLIELLVVIAIIAILAAILFPVFQRAKENANNTGCLTNLNQIGKSTLTYLDDFEGYYWSTDPALGAAAQPFPKALSKYLRNRDVFKCKADGRRNPATDTGPAGVALSGVDLIRCSYGCNEQLWTKMPTKRLRMAEVATASKFILLFDDSHGDGSAEACLGNPGKAGTFKVDYQTGRHGGVDNYVMADTHVKAVKKVRTTADDPAGTDGLVTDSKAMLTFDPTVNPVK